MCFFNKNFFHILNFILKNEFFLNKNFLIDLSLFENSNKNQTYLKINSIIFYNYYFFTFNIKIIFFLKKYLLSNHISLSKIYFNSK